MIPLFRVLMAPEAGAKLLDTLYSGQIAQGPRVDEFEIELAREMGLFESQRLVAVNSGTSAIHLALVLAGVRPGDDVAVTPMTCAATIAPILHLGARPLWVDVDAETGLMSPASLDWRLTSKTSAIVAVDWAGKPCAYEAIHKAAGGIPVIQDAAHAMFAVNDNRPIGYASRDFDRHFVAWSLQAIKHLTTGDGGILLCPNDELDQRARRLRWFGFDRTSGKDFRCAQDLQEAGYKFHMNDLAASIGLANLGLAKEAVERHRRNAKALCKELANLGPRVRLAHEWDPGSSWWVFPLLVDGRDAFTAYLAERGVQTSQVHRRNDEHPVFRRAAGWQRDLEGLDRFSVHQVNVPCGWWVTLEDLALIIDAIQGYARS